jgi:nitroreductase
LNQEQAASRSPGSVRAMDVEEAIRTRRTHKVYEKEPVDRATVEELLELARWAPNHHLTEPWRFRVIGPETFERLVAAGAPNEASKLGRAPTLVTASVVYSGDDYQNREDLLATGAAVYIVLLAAHARGLASYWRTPALFETDAARDALGFGPDEEFVGLIHLGRASSEPPGKDRQPPSSYVEFLP